MNWSSAFQTLPYTLVLLVSASAIVTVFATGSADARAKSPEAPVWVKVSSQTEEATTSNNSSSNLLSSLSLSGLAPCPLLSRRRSTMVKPPNPHSSMKEDGEWLYEGRSWRGEHVHDAHPDHAILKGYRPGAKLARHVHVLPVGVGVLERSQNDRRKRGLSTRYTPEQEESQCSCEPASIGVKWPLGTGTDYTLYTTNSLGLGSAQVLSMSEHGRSAWGCSKVIEGSPYLEFDHSSAPSLSSPPNGRNDVLFTDDYGPSEQILGMVISWGYFDTPPYTLVESDMFMNSKIFSLGTAQQVFTHEWGHMYGLADVYGTACWDRTIMFGVIESGGSNGQAPITPSLEDMASLGALGYYC